MTSRDTRPQQPFNGLTTYQWACTGLPALLLTFTISSNPKPLLILRSKVLTSSSLALAPPVHIFFAFFLLDPQTRSSSAITNSTSIPARHHGTITALTTSYSAESSLQCFHRTRCRLSTSTVQCINIVQFATKPSAPRTGFFYVIHISCVHSLYADHWSTFH